MVKIRTDEVIKLNETNDININIKTNLILKLKKKKR